MGSGWRVAAKMAAPHTAARERGLPFFYLMIIMVPPEMTRAQISWPSRRTTTTLPGMPQPVPPKGPPSVTVPSISATFAANVFASGFEASRPRSTVTGPSVTRSPVTFTRSQALPVSVAVQTIDAPAASVRFVTVTRAPAAWPSAPGATLPVTRNVPLEHAPVPLMRASVWESALPFSTASAPSSTPGATAPSTCASTSPSSTFTRPVSSASVPAPVFVRPPSSPASAGSCVNGTFHVSFWPASRSERSTFAPFVETTLSVRSLIVWLPALGRKQPPFQKISAVEPVWKFPVEMTSACITPPCRFRRELAP